MHSEHAKLGNANALHRASRHAAQLERAIMLCMHSKHANLAMQLHCTVPAGAQHGSREPQYCACTPSMQNFGNANALYRASRHTAQLERAIVLCMHSKHAKLGNANALHRASRHAAQLERAIVLCMHSKHANLAMQLHCTVPAGTQHGSREP